MTTSDQHCQFTISGGSHRSLLLPHLCSFLIFHSFHLCSLYRLFFFLLYFTLLFIYPLSVPILYLCFFFLPYFYLFLISPLFLPVLYIGYFFRSFRLFYIYPLSVPVSVSVSSFCPISVYSYVSFISAFSLSQFFFLFLSVLY
jgi:hypothetical protein